MKKNILIIIFFLSTVTFAEAQDIHFSDFFSAPLILNPANTTNYHGNWNLVANYRNQGVKNVYSYITSTVAFDFPLYINNQRAGLGFFWINDKSDDKSLSVNKFYLSSAYFVKISGNSYLHMGLQGGVVNKKNDYSDMSFPDQFDMTTGYFNPALSTSETLTGRSITYLDLNWGIIWSRKTPEFTSEAGISMFHYNRPEESFMSGDNRLSPRYVAHMFFEKMISDALFVKPKVIYVRQDKASELIAGFNIGFLSREKNISKDIYAGTFFRGGFNRNPDSFIFNVGFNYKSFDFVIGYDIEIPGYEFYTATRSAFELSVSYKRPETNIKNKLIPCTVF